MLPGALFWELFALQTYAFVLVRTVVLSMAVVPAYSRFAFSLGPVGALHALAGLAKPGGRGDVHGAGVAAPYWVRDMVSGHPATLA